jgi:hypothetical protein
MEMNKNILDLNREVDTIKKTKSEAMLEIETLGKKSGTTDVSDRIQKMELIDGCPQLLKAVSGEKKRV